MANMRRHSPEPPPGPPQVEWKPGLADDMMHELAPLLAEEGIDLNGIDVPDIQTLQAAMNRAVERLNMTRFTPVGQPRELAVSALRQAVEALTDDDTTQASAVLEQVQPESPDDSVATVSGCIGVAVSLLDDWLTDNSTGASAGNSRRVNVPAGHWVGERAATDILALARKGRAFRSLDTLIVKQGGKNVLYGSVLALAAAVQARTADTSVAEILRTKVR